MKIAWVILASASMHVFASAQEVPTPTPASTPPPRVYPVALPNYDEETATRLQIFLDNGDFGPGKIDGRMGEFFRKALISYKHAHAMPKTGAVDKWLLDQVPVTYTTYTIKEDDLKSVGTFRAARRSGDVEMVCHTLRCSNSSPSGFIPRRLTFRNSIPAKTGNICSRRNSEGAECFPVRGREIHGRKSS